MALPVSEQSRAVPRDRAIRTQVEHDKNKLTVVKVKVQPPTLQKADKLETRHQRV